MFSPNSKVLVVDDMMTMRKIVAKICQELGLSVVASAADGQEAWNFLRESKEKVDLIISDWNMPQLTGLDLLRKVRADEKLKNTPFLMVTAEAEQAQVVEAVKAGVDNYVIKPFSAGALKEKLEAVYKKRYG